MPKLRDMKKPEWTAFIRFILLELDDNCLTIFEWQDKFSIYNREQSADKMITKLKNVRKCFGEYSPLTSVCLRSCNLRGRCEEAKNGIVRKCASCGRPAMFRSSRCSLCSARRKKQREHAKMTSKCSMCGDKTFNGHVKCHNCKKKQDNYRNSLNKKRIENGLCVRCNAKLPNKKYKCCATCRRKERHYRRDNNDRQTL